jgi:large subunit ribosomal protein L11
MAKEITAQIKIQAPGGKATPAPPIGPALGQHGVNIGQFVSQFNERTADMGGMTLPVVISVYADRTFDFVIKSPPAAALLLKAVGIEKGSGVPHTDKVGTVTQAQLEEIATTKMKDLNAFDIKAAAKIIAGTARSMGIDVE